MRHEQVAVVSVLQSAPWLLRKEQKTSRVVVSPFPISYEILDKQSTPPIVIPASLNCAE